MPSSSPEERALLARFAEHPFVGFLGPGVGQLVGYPSRRGLVETIIERSRTAANREELTEIAHMLGESAIDEAIEALTSVLTRPVVHQLVVDVLRAVQRRPFPNVLRALAQLPLYRCFTVAQDKVAQELFAGRHPIVLSGLPGETDRLARKLFDPDVFAVVELMGSFVHEDSLRLTAAELGALVRLDPVFSRTVASLASGASILFFGMSAKQIDDVLGRMPDFVDATSGVPHFAVLTQHQLRRSVEAKRLLGQYGIHAIVKNASDVKDLFDELGFDRGIRVLGGTFETAETRSSSRPAKRLESVWLRDIGPFHDLKLDFDANWNVILGDNGVGKTTILRAIALALRGPEGVPDPNVLRRLLRSEQPSGTIEIDLGGDIYRVELHRQNDNSVFARLSQLSVVQQGNLVVAAFPALRGLTSHKAKSQTRTLRDRPIIEDLEPLITDDVDRRLDDLQQWIVDAAAQGRKPLIDAVFLLIKEFLGPSAALDFDDVDPSSSSVIVRTRDGPIGLDQLSQGMSSLLAWLGYTLQRLYEVYSTSTQPQSGPALVLVDEIDAHLHPEWQRMLVATIKKVFPNVQIVATSHSPLIVGSLSREEVLVCRREAGDIVVSRPEAVTGLRADQILASTAFSMSSTRNPAAADALAEYEFLTLKPNRTDEESERLASLAAQIDDFQFGGVTPEAIRKEKKRREEVRATVSRLTSDTLSDAERRAVQKLLTEDDPR